MKKSSQELKKEIKAAQEFLSNLKTESQVALRKRNQLRLEQEKETDRLLAERKLSLEVIENNSQKELERLEDTSQGLKKEIGNLEFNRDSLNTEISGKISELNSLHEQLGTVKTAIESENSKITVLISQQIGVQTSIDTLKEQIPPILEELTIIKADIASLIPQRAELVDSIQLKTDEFDTLLEESERDLSVLKDQKSAIKREIAESEDQFKAERSDLASRKMAADKRDDNLRAREYKVSRDEQMIEQNAGLLNL